MLKKFVCMLLVFSILSVFGMTVFAAPTDSPTVTPTATPTATPQVKAEKAADSLADVFKAADEETKQFLVTITKPDKETDSTYKSSYVISGVSEKTGVTVVLQVYDADAGEYVSMENTDGESSWEIGSFGMFSKEIELKKGANAIKILAYKTPQKGAPEVKDIQVCKFTITLLDSGIKALFNQVADFTKGVFNIR